MTAIENGYAVSDKKQTEVVRALRYGDSSYHAYRLEFLSESFPKPAYRFDCAVDESGRYYICFYDDITGYRVKEIDGTLHGFLTAGTASGD